MSLILKTWSQGENENSLPLGAPTSMVVQDVALELNLDRVLLAVATEAPAGEVRLARGDAVVN